MSYQYLEYPKCSTCIKARKWLEKNQIAFESRDITVNNPTKEELKVWQEKSGLPFTKFFNTSGLLYREQNLKEKIKVMTVEEMVEILSTNGMLVKRPILVGNDFVLVGFKEDEWKKKLLPPVLKRY
ncbi:MAG TPA: ArsC family transcriptional regulator [Lachnoclostridium phytofermentans]|uniref:ArsC family transcriptional regulator n=1 Tax=Lachnoclostridium phytofermentans TaxID=66219 RepID=A0A3D2X488_9FIRM|nr:arsenate reductase family protein [Lachnoclostridium sp.]HCL01959.1 ArsC family transcriptional regulator [Lachnoclostridium phytofermentans]